MELNEKDLEVLRVTAEQLWRKGCHNPGEATIAQAFTDLVRRAHAEAQTPEKAK